AEEQQRTLPDLSDAERAAVFARLLADPLPETPENELLVAIDKRRQAAWAVADSPLDVRWRLVFLHGTPTQRQVVTCGAGFHPIEVWDYAGEHVVVYQPRPTGPWRLWSPALETKADLFTD